MVKIIQPRRTNKTVSAQQYWQIRDKLKKKSQIVHHTYHENEVQNRYRYKKLREQIKQFNPLSYFLQSHNDLSDINKTHTHAYLQQINYRLPIQIIQIKNLLYGLASILQNIQQIYMILWEHLDNEDSWKLMQTIVQDTREQSYQCWMEKGLGKLVQGVDHSFNQSKFKYIFSTVCIVLQSCYQKIVQSQESVYQLFQKLSQIYFTNSNKYIRKYSIIVSSYVLNNLSQTCFYGFVKLVINDQKTYLYQFIGDILAQRLRYSDGCLTPNSLQMLIQMIKWLKENKVSSDILSGLTHKLLTNLQQKTNLQSETLFDLIYVIKGLVHLCRDGGMQPDNLFKGLYLYLTQNIKQKYAKKRILNLDILKQLSELLWQSLPQLNNNKHIYYLLGISLMIEVKDVGNMINFILNEQNEEHIKYFLQIIPKDIDKQITMVLIVSLSKYLQKFLLLFNQVNFGILEIVYQLYFISQKYDITMELAKLINKKISIQELINYLVELYGKQTSKKQLCYCYTIVLLRVLLIINVENSMKLDFSKLFTSSVKQYYQVIGECFQRRDPTNPSIFSCSRYVNQIFLYSHAQIPFVQQGFNMIESFIEVENKLGLQIIDRQSTNFQLWQKIAINRQVLSSGINHEVLKEESGYLLALQSRLREVRLITLTHLQQSQLFTNHQPLIAKLIDIDSNDIDLTTQRQTKRLFFDALKYIKQYQLPLQINNILIYWCIGFGFTGFKLIQESFCQFVSAVLEWQQVVNVGQLMNFIQYYTFKNSRIFHQSVLAFFNNNSIRTYLSLPQIFVNMLRMDFCYRQLDTIQFIGLERIANAISQSQKIKNKLGNRLVTLIDQYFSQQFVRYKKILANSQSILAIPRKQLNQLLLPPKTTYLKQILKMIPNTYIPPLQCLHYTEDYLQLQSVKELKKQQWQQLWHKNTKIQHQRILFDNMSNKEVELYIHFLWGQLLKADVNRLRVIIEYIRDYMTNKIDYFMQIYLNELLLGLQLNKTKINNILIFMDSRKLLTFIYIMKTIVKSLKNYVRDHCQFIFNLFIIICDVLFQDRESEDQRQYKMVNQNQDYVQQQQEQNQKYSQSKKYKKYKNHRKQLYKILNSLIMLLADEIPIAIIEQLLSIFDRNKKIQNLGKITGSSISGLLLMFQQLTKCKKFHSICIKYHIIQQICHIFKQCHTLTPNGQIPICITILNSLLSIQSDQQQQHSSNQLAQQPIHIQQKLIHQLQQSLYTLLAKFANFKNQFHNKLLNITLSVMKRSLLILKQWQNYLILQFNKIINNKSMSQILKYKLTIVINICMEYIYKSQTNGFLQQLLVLIPQLKQFSHRQLLAKLIQRQIQSGKQQSFSKNCVKIVSQLNSTVMGTLVQEIDYPAFFDGIQGFKQNFTSFSIQQLQFIIYNMITYLTASELSVRKAVIASIKLFLSILQTKNRQLVLMVFRIVCNELKKPYHSQDQLFWSIFSCIGHFVRWVVKNDAQKSPNYQVFSKYVDFNYKPEHDIFQQLCALAQNKKLDGLKSMRAILQNKQIKIEHIMGSKCPNLLTCIFLPVLQHFILPIHSQNTKYELVSNLSSSLTHVSIQIYELLMKKSKKSVQKKQLKRMISKLKFDQDHFKKNTMVIKIIGAIVQSIGLPKVTDTINKMVKQHGFEQFQRKLVEKEGKKSALIEDGDESQQQEQKQRRKALNRYDNQIQDEQLINLNYLLLDKKLMQVEQIEQHVELQDQDQLIKFLKIHVLIPLKTMLVFQNKTYKNSKVQYDKSRMLLSIVVCKILMRFPVDVFMTEFKKVLGRLGKLLKKRQLQIRQSSRKCLSQIAKLVGPQLLYLIINQLKYHLKQNFQNHVFNYSIYYILQKYGKIQNGLIDHCLPIILPSIIDQIFGMSSIQKQLVNENKIPTLNMQVKKRKGNELLNMICRYISVKRVEYLIKYFQKFVLEFINCQNNVVKYQNMLVHVLAGFNKNQGICLPQNGSLLIGILHQSIKSLKAKIKLYKFQLNESAHQSTICQHRQKIKKPGRQTLQIPQETSRNISIFKSKKKQIQDKKNQQIIITCLILFYQSLLMLLIKKRIISQQLTTQQFTSILQFIIQCLHHRDNRLVHKSLKIIHAIIHWNKLINSMEIKKKITSRIFQLVQQLTSADQHLVKECFVILNDLFQQVNINADVLHVLVSIVKLHVTTADKMVEQQPYKLFKTVLIKISQSEKLLTDIEVYQLYELIRTTLLTTTLQHIRNICKDICCLYIKYLPYQQTNSHKHQSHIKPKSSSINQISFYLNNLDCKYSQTQLAVIEIIKNYVQYHSKTEIEETGETIVMGLGIAYSNDQDNYEKLSQTIKIVISKIDNSKTIGLVQKCLIWVVNNQNQLVVVCGYFILSCLLQVKDNLLNSTRKSTLSNLCTRLLQAQHTNLQTYELQTKQKIQRMITIKNNPQWQDIIQDQNIVLKIQKNFIAVVKILDIMREQFKGIEHCQVELLWKLVAIPSEVIHAKCGELLIKINNIAPAIGQKLLSLAKQEEDSFRNKTMKIVRNVNQQYGCKLIKKVLEQLQNSQTIISVLESLVLGLLNRISRSILNLKKNSKSMKLSLQLLQLLLTTNQQHTKKLLANDKIISQIFWNIAKINRNQLIPIDIKQLNEQFGQIIKINLGQSQYYRKLANVQANRKQKKTQDKAQMLKLAITDQSAYALAKAKKKHKKT